MKMREKLAHIISENYQVDERFLEVSSQSCEHTITNDPVGIWLWP
jgi:hypothetical protein